MVFHPHQMPLENEEEGERTVSGTLAGHLPMPSNLETDEQAT
jgi:hypothetical protein